MGWGLSHNLGASGTSLAPHLSGHLAKTQGNVGPTRLSDFHEWSAWRQLAAFIFLKWETLRLCVTWGLEAWRNQSTPRQLVSWRSPLGPAGCHRDAETPMSG